MEWLLLGVSLALMVVCGLFVAAEFALVTVDRAEVERAAGEGDRGAAGVSVALRSLSTQLSGAQVGITLTNLAIGFLAEPSIASLLKTPLKDLGLPSGAVVPTAAAIGMVIATFATMIFGELVPKNVALSLPLSTAKATQSAQRAFTMVMSLPIKKSSARPGPAKSWPLWPEGLPPKEPWTPRLPIWCSVQSRSDPGLQARS
jgi:CBS domain containing-hemolysin-like protein